jgi:tRNA-Thr(GGU) m(6)t(6)A37 methyltransferase TsaA
MQLQPIGVIRTPHSEPSGMPIQGRFAEQVEGTVEVDPGWAEGLADLDGFSHLILLYVFHRSGPAQPTVTPYLDRRPRGLFATRAPRRPNPIGLTIVRLLAVDGATLRIGGADMLDGTPLLDIKPWVPAFDDPGPARAGWIEERLAAGDASTTSDDRFHREG